MDDYSDIINKKRPEHINDAFSVRHPHMRRQDRAKIFSPFAALRGFEETAAKREIQKQQRTELSEDTIGEISFTLQHIDELLDQKQAITVKVKYFKADADGRGVYEYTKGRVEKIDTSFMKLKINGLTIDFCDIYSIETDNGSAPQQ